MKRILQLTAIITLLATFTAQLSTAFAQNTVFTYQGRVLDNGTNFTGVGQFQFALVTSINTNQTATAVTDFLVGNGQIQSYAVTSGGSGYVTAPTVTVTGGGSGATATATISGGAVISINPVSHGMGYLGSPLQVIISPPSPSFSNYTNYWSNDGTSVNGSEPATIVNVNVADGLFTVALGDTNIAGMAAIPAALFQQQQNLQLLIWFNDGTNGFAALNPPQNLTPTPYATYAASAAAANNLAAGLTIQNNSDGAPNVIGGSSVNYVANGVEGATIAGGGTTNSGGRSYPNSVTGNFGTVGGGTKNTASGSFATVSGGDGNIASGNGATVSGGAYNTANSDYATVAGGEYNSASGYASFAAGSYASAVNQGAFVWADSQYANFTSTANDQFLIRAQGGVGIGTASPDRPLAIQGDRLAGEWLSLMDTNGVTRWHLNNSNGGLNFAQTLLADYRLFLSTNNGYVGIGTGNPNYTLDVAGNIHANGNVYAGSVELTSDRNAKENFQVMNPATVLAKVASLPITEWNYKTDSHGVQHLGPMAQDFHAAFDLNGKDDRHISVIDEGGVALAAIQGLNEKVETRSQKLESENAELKRQNDSLQKQLDDLKQMVQSLLKKD